MDKRIDQMIPKSGRILKEDDSVVNQADMLEAIYKAFCVDKNAGVSIFGADVKVDVVVAPEVQVKGDPASPLPTTIVGSLANVQTATQDSSANSPNTITITGVAGQSIYISTLEVVISSASAGNDIKVQIKDGATLKWKEVIGSGSVTGSRVGVSFSIPIKITVGSTATIVVDAGGAGVVSTANIAYGIM